MHPRRPDVRYKLDGDPGDCLWWTAGLAGSGQPRTLDGLSYQGTTQVPTAGGTVTMMKLTMSSLTLTGGVRATVTQNGQTTVTRLQANDLTITSR